MDARQARLYGEEVRGPAIVHFIIAATVLIMVIIAETPFNLHHPILRILLCVLKRLPSSLSPKLSIAIALRWFGWELSQTGEILHHVQKGLLILHSFVCGNPSKRVGP